MNSLDLSASKFLGAQWLHAPALENFMQLLAGNDLVKGAILVGLLWFLWMGEGADRRRGREVVISTTLGALIAGGLSRAISHLFPFRKRPFETSGVDFETPLGSLFESKGGSFPSDHASVAFALVTGILVLRPRLGILVSFYLLIFVGLPRVYLGIHWATDIVGGAILGIAATLPLCHRNVSKRLARPFLNLEDRLPGVFYPMLFLVMFGIMTRLEDYRSIARWIVDLLRP